MNFFIPEFHVIQSDMTTTKVSNSCRRRHSSSPTLSVLSIWILALYNTLFPKTISYRSLIQSLIHMMGANTKQCHTGTMTPTILEKLRYHIAGVSIYTCRNVCISLHWKPFDIHCACYILHQKFIIHHKILKIGSLPRVFIGDCIMKL